MDILGEGGWAEVLSTVERLSLSQRLLIHQTIEVEQFIHSTEVVHFSECPLSKAPMTFDFWLIHLVHVYLNTWFDCAGMSAYPTFHTGTGVWNSTALTCWRGRSKQTCDITRTAHCLWMYVCTCTCMYYTCHLYRVYLCSNYAPNFKISVCVHSLFIRSPWLHDVTWPTRLSSQC